MVNQVNMKASSIVIIGSSGGGPRILKELFSGLPKLNGAIILIQHMPRFLNESIRQNLEEWSNMNVKIAQDNEQIENGTIYIAPSERHLELINNRQIRLFFGNKVHFVCPSIDVALKSLKWEFGIRHIGIILSGLGMDGAEGISYLKKIGGVTIAQSEETCAIYGMPKEAIETGNVELILTPDEIRDWLIELVGVVTD
jgi:two-component system chemotaxis response regulator CheB